MIFWCILRQSRKLCSVKKSWLAFGFGGAEFPRRTGDILYPFFFFTFFSKFQACIPEKASEREKKCEYFRSKKAKILSHIILFGKPTFDIVFSFSTLLATVFQNHLLPGVPTVIFFRSFDDISTWIACPMKYL